MTLRIACVVAAALSMLWVPEPARGTELDKALRDCLGADAPNCVPDSALKRCLLVVDTVTKQIAHASGISAGRRDTLLMDRLKLVKLMCEELAPDPACHGVTIERVGMALQYTSRAQADLVLAAPYTQQAEKHSRRWAVVRKVTDDFDPTGETKALFPAMFAYSHDMRVAASEDIIAKGSVRVTGRPSNLTSGEFVPAAGLQLDVESSQPASAGRIDFATPLAWRDTYPTKEFFGVESLRLLVTPDFQTDRAGRRHVYQINVSLTVAGPFHAGVPPKKKQTGLRKYYLPSLSLESGKVQDAGGNAEFESLKQGGAWSRPVLSTIIGLKRTIAGHEWSLSAEPSLRYDSQSNRSSTYSEEILAFGVDDDSHLFAAANYADGRKPPALESATTWLIGLGIKY
jgi:hypothetical protein